MSQLSLLEVEISPSLEAAKKLIRTDVKRGYDISSIKRGMAGWSSPGGLHVSVGGYLNGKNIPSSKIVVYRDINGKEVNEVFELSKVYKELEGELQDEKHVSRDETML